MTGDAGQLWRMPCQSGEASVSLGSEWEWGRRPRRSSVGCVGAQWAGLVAGEGRAAGLLWEGLRVRLRRACLASVRQGR